MSRSVITLLLLTLCLILMVAVSLLSGVVVVTTNDLVSLFTGTGGAATMQQKVLLDIRLPRVLLALFVGAGLAVCGAAMQGLFRNPLADPALIGISSGAALAAVATIVLSARFATEMPVLTSAFALPVMAFAGSLLATALIYRFSSHHGRVDVPTMLLAGVAFNAIASALIGLLSYLASSTELRSLTFWNLGSLGHGDRAQLVVALPVMLFCMVLIPFYAKALNAILLGEAEAGHLGFRVERVKRVLIVLVALVVGVAVSLTGVIGFVGLVVPHLLRLVIGPDHRLLLPASALLGANLLLAADWLARTVVMPAEIPIGIITALIGGPFFLWLLLRYRRRGSF